MQLRPGRLRHAKEITESLIATPEPAAQQSLIPDEIGYDFLEAAIKELSEEQRQCVILFYIKNGATARSAMQPAIAPCR